MTTTPRPRRRLFSTFVAGSALAGTLAGGLSGAVVAPAQAGITPPDFDLKASQVDVSALRANVVSRMAGNAYGWQLAVAQDGLFATSAQGGTAISAADNNGAAVAMQPTMRMELASVSKNMTAVATMKLLRRAGLTVESKVVPHLPASWDFGSGWGNLRFRHLLNHTSGINQAILAQPADERPTNNSWNAMQTIAGYDISVGSQRQYKNANYAFLRILNALLWDKHGGAKFVDVEVEKFNSKGIVIDTKIVKQRVDVTAANHTSYSLDFQRKHVFSPAGLPTISCIAPGTTTGARSYPLGGNQNSTGTVLGTSSSECSGARGIAMSAMQLVQYLAHLRHGDIIEPEDLATMDALRAGWSEDSNGGDGGEFGTANGVPDNALSPGVFWHGGALLGDRQVNTCAMTFADGTQAALIVNSALASDSPCGVLIKAYDDAL